MILLPKVLKKEKRLEELLKLLTRSLKRKRLLEQHLRLELEKLKKKRNNLKPNCQQLRRRN